MFKKTIRRTIRRLRDWLEEDPRKEKRNYDKDEFLYPWLNSVFSEILEIGTRRPDYAWGVLQGVNLAKALGISRVSVIEFGVAGGRSLVELERVSQKVESIYDVGIDVYGFDRGVGLPRPVDYRDTPNLVVEGFFQMDQEKLRNRLRVAQLILGPLEDTITQFIATKPSPVAFIAVDVVLYSSTMQVLKLFDADQALLLPRIHCYFDDIFGFTLGDHNGELLAISDFNSSHSIKKISKIHGLKYFVPGRYRNTDWVEKFWIAHIFDHALYGQYDGLVKRGTLDLDQWD
jgi:hypothetical protein